MKIHDFVPFGSPERERESKSSYLKKNENIKKLNIFLKYCGVLSLGKQEGSLNIKKHPSETY